MKQEDIIRMAREAGAAVGSPAPGVPEVIFTHCLDIYRFATLVRADEREAILAIEASSAFNRMYGEFCPKAKDLADAIRARGNT
jgi:hypothetical protein